MAEKIELLISAKNQAESALRDARTDVKTLERQVRKATDALEQTGEGRRDVERLTDSLAKARVEAKRWALVQKDTAQELDKATNATQRNRRETDRLNRSHGKATRGGSAFAAGWGKVTGVAAGVTAAIAGLSGAFTFLSSSVNEARSARKAAAQTVAVMRSMGRTEAPAALEKMINHLESISGIDGDNIREMTNVLLTFGNVQGKTLTRANKLALDLSVAFGKDLQSSAVMVGKALNDPVKGLTALSRIGVSFTAQQQDQVKAMVAAGDAAGAQALIMKELGRQVGGSAKAQADGIAKTQVAWGNLQEAVGDVVMSISTGMGMDIPGALKTATKAIERNKWLIVGVLQAIASGIFKWISVWMKWQSVVLKGLGYLAGAAATTLQILAKTGLVSQTTADAATSLADGLGGASEQANKASTWFDTLSTKTKNASERTLALDRALKQIDGRKVRASVEVTLTSAWDAVDAATDAAQNPPGRRGRKKQEGDTASPRTRGAGIALGMAHARLSAGLAGTQTVTSGLRFDNLGSPGSDHARGRALDVTGPGLNAYANRVRAGGGYAAFHGSGPDRHLHAVPGAGTVTETHHHYQATINNPSSSVDVRAVFRAMQAEAAADSRRRGKGWPHG